MMRPQGNALNRLQNDMGLRPPQPQEEVEERFGRAMQKALRQSPRRISPMYLYDEVGSKLFDAICDLPEYYVTRTELDVLEQHGSSIARYVGPRAELIEFGAGSFRKLKALLQELRQPRRYVPVDISGDYLQAEVASLEREYPWLKVDPVVADFTLPFDIGPSPRGTEKQVGLYLGSSIGNLDHASAVSFLRMAAALLPGAAMLVGIDLVKDPSILHAAYNDSAGVTAAFNLNLLVRANRELGMDFELDQFAHHATYNPFLQRIEMHLISRCRQTVHLNGERFTFEEGETFHTESSQKFTLKGFAEMAALAGWKSGPSWRDPNHWFALQWLYQDQLDVPGA